MFTGFYFSADPTDAVVRGGLPSITTIAIMICTEKAMHQRGGFYRRDGAKNLHHAPPLYLSRNDIGHPLPRLAIHGQNPIAQKLFSAHGAIERWLDLSAAGILD